MEKILKGNKIVLGTCYYPEHWDENLWRDDLKRMKENGIAVVRVAEFAWSKFEAVEGDFNYDFFDRFLDTAKKSDMSVIFCTPTATPPAWLTNQYPEVLNAKIDGTLLRHGARRHYNYNSPVYIRFTRRIVEKIAEHYGKHPAIVGWQIDNELNCETDEFYSKSDSIAFREFLKEKYSNLASLNDAWGTLFWNQTYTSWAEVYVPGPTVSDSVNPHQVMDYIRFVSNSARSFAKMQSDIIKRYKKDEDFITTNGMFTSLDNHLMTKESLDFFTYDSYPNFAYCLNMDPVNSKDFNDRKWSRNLTEVRSISPGKFGIMEQQSGPNGWNTKMEAPSPKPGQMTLWTLQSIAHGADFVSYFRWRTCTMGTEIYWHGILDYSNRNNRRLGEVKNIYEKTKAISCAAGSLYQAAFAVIKDYDNIWDAKLDVWHRRVDQESEAGIFQAAQLAHSPFDYVFLDYSDGAEILFEKYPVLFYPHAAIVTKERALLLEEYVQKGGTLVLGCRTGYKDITGKCPMHKLPGLLRNLSGADVIDYTFISPDDEKAIVEWDGIELEAAVFNDVLEPLGNAKLAGTYKNNYYAGKGALVYNEWGKGRVYYFGGAFNKETAAVFLKKLDLFEPYADVITLPESCELTVRKKDNTLYYFVLNFGKSTATISIKKEMKDLYSSKMVSGNFDLPAYGTAVYV